MEVLETGVVLVKMRNTMRAIASAMIVVGLVLLCVGLTMTILLV
jgi:hypothetical protein